MNDRVSVAGLCVHGFHGVFPEEKKLGQKFYLDIDCDLSLSACAKDDDYNKAVCYGALCDLAAEISARGPYNLIETFAARVADAVLEQFGIVNSVAVRVRKPSAPIAASFEHVEIEITRTRRRRVAFSLGSNIGDKLSNLRTALAWMNTLDGTVIDGVSRFYKTAPWGETDQDWFLNACAIGHTTADPEVLLKELKRIELTLGRVPSRRWGPRSIDIDILFVDDVTQDTDLLTLPHKELFNRAFVLIPLADIAADHTVAGRSIGEAASAFDPQAEAVIPLEE